MCLASKHDTRVDGIIRQQLGLGEWVYYLNKPNAIDLFEILKQRFAYIDLDTQTLSKISESNSKILSQHGGTLQQRIFNGDFN
jgi:hypothetical protein